jgi:hypothetical protein
MDMDVCNAEATVVPYKVFCEYESLLSAHHRARNSRRHKHPVANFEIAQLANIEKLRKELQEKTYRQGAFHKFYVYEPKKRQIQSIPYRDRIVQHVLCDRVLSPYFIKRVVNENCGCVEGRGQHYAVKLLKRYIRRASAGGNQVYVLKCDIKKYFPSLSHEVIKERIVSKIGDADIRNLFNGVIDAYETPKQFLIDNGISTDIKRGVPIGNQSSQVIGYYYLDPMDRFIKEKLRIKYYVRYMDDFVILHNDREYLKWVLCELERGLNGSLKLQLNNKTQITPLKNGIKFLGQYISVKNGKVVVRIQRRTINKYKTVVNYINKNRAVADKNREHYCSVIASYNGYMKHTNSRGKGKQIKKRLNVSVKPQPKKFVDIYNEIMQDE